MAIPYLSGPFDIGQLQNTLNMLIAQINLIVTGAIQTFGGGSTTAKGQTTNFMVPLPKSTLLEYFNIQETAGMALDAAPAIIFYPIVPDNGAFTTPVATNGVETQNIASVTYSNGTSGIGATLTHTINGAISSSITGVANVNDIAVVAGQTDARQNGVYKVTNAGSAGTAWVLTRLTGFDISSGFKKGNFYFPSSGGQPSMQSSPSNPIIGVENITYTDGTEMNTSYAIAGNDIITVDCRAAGNQLPSIYENAPQLCDPVNDGIIAFMSQDSAAGVIPSFDGASFNFSVVYSPFIP